MYAEAMTNVYGQLHESVKPYESDDYDDDDTGADELTSLRFVVTCDKMFQCYMMM